MKTTLALTLTLSPGEREQLVSMLNDIGDFPPNTVTRLFKNRRTILPLLGERAGVRAFVTLFCLILLQSFFCLRALGQSYAIDWSTIDGGGGTSTGGVYAVSGTIGQPDAGAMSGGNFTLQGGFWSVIAAVQTPGAPLLTVARSGGSVVISWPSPSTDFVLQQNNNVANTNGWSAYGGAVTDNGIIKSVTINPPSGNWFFRLMKQ